MFNPFLQHPEQITAEWLNAALATEANPSAGAVKACRVSPLETEGNTGWYALAEIDTEPATSIPLRLFFKVATNYANMLTSQFQNYATEISFYRNIAPHCGTRFLKFLFGAVDEQNDRGIVVLEAFDPTRTLSTYDGLTPAQAAKCLAVIAQNQAAWWNKELPLARSGKREDTDALLMSMHGRMRERWPSQRNHLRRLIPTMPLAPLDEILESTDGILTTRARSPWSIIQTDCRAENIAILPSKSGHEVVIFDWQRAAPGPALFDVASLLGTSLQYDAMPSWSELVRGYLDELRKNGVTPPDPETAMQHIQEFTAFILHVRVASWLRVYGADQLTTKDPATDNWHFKTIERCGALLNKLLRA